MFAPVILFLGSLFRCLCAALTRATAGAIFLVLVLQRDVLLYIGIKLADEGSGTQKEKLKAKLLSQGGTTLTVMALQSFVVRFARSSACVS